MKAVVGTLVPEASSKERILRAAQTVFAKKGFDGARVDEIARLAEVNKALIYYYFKSKEEILHALLHLAIEDIGASIGDPVDLSMKVFKSETATDELVYRFVSFIRERRQLLTIVMMELLKDTERRDVILSHLADEVWQAEVFSSLGVDIDAAQARVTEFFTGLMPIIMFVLLGESWEKLYGQDRDGLTRLFVKAFEETHIRYSREVLNERKAKKQEGPKG
jgi:TetR/AcrR family transcriptional regulator